MCIICLEFNKSRDFGDARGMIEAARREVTVITEEHLRRLEFKLQKLKDEGSSEEIKIDDVD
ncbi:MAG: hypothetical protein H7249_09500 [Chitinophagaceae bacterium]|nr:hypothetical protein [Oligoflexus sp.]